MSIVYLSGCVNEPTNAAAQQQPRLGMLAQPGNSVHLQSHHYSVWGIDCGAYGKARNGRPWTEQDTCDYLRWLRQIKRQVNPDRSYINTDNVLFAVTPDVLSFVDGHPVGDAQATWERGLRTFEAIRKRGYKAALVAQDGILDVELDWDAFDVLFIGGSDAMKLGNEGAAIAAAAKRHGKPVHMGRCNSNRRLVYAQSIGCDSADGTFIGYGPNKNLPKVLRWLENTATPQQRSAAA